MAITCPERATMSVGSTRLVRVNGTNDLDDGASFTGTPTVAEQDTSVLTLDNKAVNSEAYTATDGTTVAIGKAIEFTAAGGAAGTSYTIRCTCSTDSSPGETLVYDLVLTFV